VIVEPGALPVTRSAALRAKVVRIPGVGPVVDEAARVEVVDRSLAIGAQGLLGLLPFLVVLASLVPAGLGSRIVGQLGGAMGLSSESEAALRLLTVDNGQAELSAGVVGLLITIVSATSFSRALQRMYVKVFDLGGQNRPGRLKVSAVWILVWTAFLALIGFIGEWADGGPVRAAAGFVATFVVQVLFWWWTLRAMLLGGRAYPQLLPAAFLTAAGSTALVVGSAYVMPAYARSSVAQFGTLGLILALASWLVAFAGTLVVGALIGRLVAQSQTWQGVERRLVGTARARGSVAGSSLEG
jgi:membrane protein